MEGDVDCQQTVKNQEPIATLVEDTPTDLPDEKLTYIALIRRCYNSLNSCRLVDKKDTDADALSYFQAVCNRTVPRDDNERDFKKTFREMFYSSKTDFSKYLVRLPHLVLLTDTRAIVNHFGVQELIMLEWDRENNTYTVKNNTKYGSLPNSERGRAIAAKRRGEGSTPRKPSAAMVRAERKERRNQERRNQERIQLEGESHNQARLNARLEKTQKYKEKRVKKVDATAVMEMFQTITQRLEKLETPRTWADVVDPQNHDKQS
jgi:hypothetical protein